MDAKLLQSLVDAGLPEKAAHIYLTLLGSKRSSIAELARASNIKRATCYEYIELLLSRGFLTRLPVGKRMYYSAVNPKKILTELKTRVARFEENMEALQEVQNAASQRPNVSFHEGKRELRAIYDDMFTTMGDTHSIFPPEAFFEHFNEEDYDKFDKAITSHALRSRDLFVKDRFVRKIQQIREKNGSDDKVDKILPEWFKSNVDVLIYSDKVALISLRDLSAIVIENKDIADLFRSMHAGLWKLS